MSRQIGRQGSVLMLANAIQSLGRHHVTAHEIFDTWPTLYHVALRYSRFVSPHIEVDGKNLLITGVGAAVNAFRFSRDEGARGQARAFILALADQTPVLCRLRMSVMTKEGRWAIWKYDQPLQDWMDFHHRSSIQIMERERPLPAGPVLVKFLSYICTVGDLELSGIQLNRVKCGV